MTKAISVQERNTNTSARSSPKHGDEPAGKIVCVAPVAPLNDAFRRSFVGGRVVETAGVFALPEADRITLLLAVRRFDSLDSNNDPQGEHDFGAVEVSGRRCFWKIDAYDRDLSGHSPDPADPTVTTRVLTIMLAEEY